MDLHRVKRIVFYLVLLFLNGLYAASFTSSISLEADTGFGSKMPFFYVLQLLMLNAVVLCLLFKNELIRIPKHLISDDDAGMSIAWMISLCFLYSVQQVICLLILAFSWFGFTEGPTYVIGTRVLVWMTIIVFYLHYKVLQMLSESGDLDFKNLYLSTRLSGRQNQILREILHFRGFIQWDTIVAFLELEHYYSCSINPSVLSAAIMRVLLQYRGKKRQPTDEQLCCGICSEFVEIGEVFVFRSEEKGADLSGRVGTGAGSVLHADCLWKEQTPWVHSSRCEISDAISEMRNMGGIVTAEERDSLVKALSD